MGLHHCEKKVSTPSLTCGELNGGDFIVKASGAMKDLHASFKRSCVVEEGIIEFIVQEHHQIKPERQAEALTT